MGRQPKSVYKPEFYSIPANLQDKLRDLILDLTGKKLTDLQLWRVHKLLDIISKRHDPIISEGWVSIDAMVLTEIVGSGYYKLRDYLVELGVIEYKENAYGGKLFSSFKNMAMQYRYTDTFRLEEFVTVEGTKRVFKERPVKTKSDKATKRLLASVKGYPEVSFLRDNLFKITIDKKAAEAEMERWLTNQASIKGIPYTEQRHQKYLSKLKTMNANEISFSLKYGNRIWTDYIAVPKALLKHTKIKGYDGTLYISDLTSAHMLLAVPLIREHRAALTSPEAAAELDKVEAMIASKRFYRTLSDQLRAEGVEIAQDSAREKVLFLQQVWNAKDDEYSINTPYRKAFNKLFPYFNGFVLAQKKGKDGNSKFSEKMTKLESRLFNDCIARRVVQELGRNTFLVGRYDAFVYKEEDRQAIERIMEEEVIGYCDIANMVKTTTLQEESDKIIEYLLPMPMSSVVMSGRPVTPAIELMSLTAAPQ